MRKGEGQWPMTTAVAEEAVAPVKVVALARFEFIIELHVLFSHEGATFNVIPCPSTFVANPQQERPRGTFSHVVAHVA